ncbi:sigma-54 dependent transcriptional regulator [Magnetospira sp. QH-2]|uniref:sigma-54-dependent transcriptional regulator n=1 Tax=Magnetospira sp. (strain QH-2) TaxID=1288970 RepID=UPI0003E814A5|nr:sigma-54 dependent transcriptional regulator [Magnetospira sp. QH-2]CCQ73263.1 C4-dicarboxylate transport transcriptional regulatory protein (response regulator in two-component reguatory system). Fused response regulator of ato opeon, in two-component system with AtoS: response regulator; sigma54 interaction protein [Magnetospira sp. QH-2]
MSEPDKGIVFFVDDEEHIRISGRQTLELAGYQVECFSSPSKVLPRLSAQWPGIIVSDIKMPDMDGLTLMSKAQEIAQDLPVVLITGHGDIAMAVQAIRDGAYDFIEKPFPADLLVDAVNRAMEKRNLVLEVQTLRRELGSRQGGALLVGKSPAMNRTRDIIANIADTGADVLIFGETGTGKELVARCLHEQSTRRDGHFVAVNCGAMPETIFESELFGHEQGAFTGAQTQRIGKIEHAAGGTLFLDEIESMPLGLQVKLLRVLQERVVERLGSNQLIPVNLRVVAATKTDLRKASEKNLFREDLYYRLNVMVLPLPTMRQRREDIPLLFHHFVEAAAARYNRPAEAPSAAQLSELMGHSWPGNVRELKNAAERFVLGYGITFDDSHPFDETDSMAGAQSLPEQVESFERSVIVQELQRQKGNIKATLERLGLPRKTLYDKMRKYDLDRRAFTE